MYLGRSALHSGWAMTRLTRAEPPFCATTCASAVMAPLGSLISGAKLLYTFCAEAVMDLKSSPLMPLSISLRPSEFRVTPLPPVELLSTSEKSYMDCTASSMLSTVASAESLGCTSRLARLAMYVYLEISLAVWSMAYWVVLSIFATVASETMVTKANMKIDSDRMASTVNEPFSPLSFTVSPSHGFLITPPF